ncbi:huntingtin-like [Ceratitis capitata]|uniref:huntingtin-like n=1 Tax=Ceratitis capitata TaxID=7213 RepID=UPI000C6C3F60|nr:huntingtin-like [Ceratitis capitata]
MIGHGGNVGMQQQLQQQQQQHHSSGQQRSVLCLLQCIAALLQQRFIWTELNQMEKPSTATATTTGMGDAAPSIGSLLTPQQRNLLLCRVLDVLVVAARQSLQHTIFYKHFKQLAAATSGVGGVGEELIDSVTENIFNDLSAAVAADKLEANILLQHSRDNIAEVNDVAVGRLLQAYAPQAVFIAKLIEVHANEGMNSGAVSLSASYLTGTAGKGGSSLNNVGGGALGGSGGGVGMSSVGASAVGVGAANGTQGVFDEGSGANGVQIPMDILSLIGVSVLRTHQFYAYAVTPFEIIQQQQREQRIEQLSPAKRAGQTSQATSSTAATSAAASGKLPTIPVESLSDVDILRKFVKRLSIFGFTTRQQFEEYFMTFLLLINKVYDENMVDEQEQFQIRSTCLAAILELLITYKTFPIVGNKLSHFHHTTRWTRINCDSISLKKLHKVQLLVSEANIFYHPNLERELRAETGAHFNYAAFACRLRDTVIGTNQFRVNQYDLNFMWQQMEQYSTNSNNSANEAELASGGSGEGRATERRGTDASMVGGGGASRYSEDIATKNYRYFTAQSGVDFKSSTQLIFDVLMQIIEHNHILVLPNLVKFTEICESRDQIKWIKEKALKLQETIPMDDTISHQHLIYLLCKTQAMLIPTLGELQQLCQLIGNYLKSSHIFIRNATLSGLLCLLECCSKTNTTIGRLSDELALLRELIVGYINRHGIIDVSIMQCSDIHTKLVWTLNYCLIEWTSKFVPQCHLLSNTVIAAGNFLRKTNNEDVYLCVLHGLERMVVISNAGGNGGNHTHTTGTSIASPGVGIVTPLLRNKIEKLALELVKLENERFSIPALQLLLSCMYMGSAKQLENTELSNGIVQDEPEIIAQQTDKVDILLHCIKSSTRDAAWIYGQVLCQIIRDLVPPNEILTKVIKEFLAINQPHCDVIAMIVYQVFRCAIDSTFLQVLQDWLICSLPTFLALPEQKGVWCLSVIFLSASINLHLIKLFPVLLSTGAAAAARAAASTSTSSTGGGGDGGGAAGLHSTAASVGGGGGVASGGLTDFGIAGGDGDVGEFHKLGQHEIALFVTAAVDFHAKLSVEQRMRFRDAFEKFKLRHRVYDQLLQQL